MSPQYLQAAEVVKQITECRMKQRKLQEELTKLQKADSRSKKYDKKKRARKSDQPLTRLTSGIYKATHLASTSGRSSDSTSTETETNESCTQKQSVSSPNSRRRSQTIESFTVVTSKS